MLVLQLFPGLLLYPLMHVAAAGSLKNVLANLLRANELYSVDANDRTPLFYALKEQNASGVTMLVEHFQEHPADFLLTEADYALLIDLKTRVSPELI